MVLKIHGLQVEDLSELLELGQTIQVPAKSKLSKRSNVKPMKVKIKLNKKTSCR